MITVQRARELRAMIEKAAGAGLDDKDGSTAVELYPALTGGGALVKSGTRINWKGALKRAAVDLWEHGGKHAGGRAELVGGRAL